MLGCPSFLGYRLPQFACIFFFTASFSARTARRLYVPPPWTPSSARDSFRRRTDFPFPRRTASRGVRSYTQPCLYLSFFLSFFLFADARTSVQPMVQPAIVNSVKQRLFRTACLFFFLFAFFFLSDVVTDGACDSPDQTHGCRGKQTGSNPPEETSRRLLESRRP